MCAEPSLVLSDIPSHVYQFTFASNPEWSRFYAAGGEIQNYLKDIAWKYDVEKYVRFRHYFQRAEWDESKQHWRLELTNLVTNEVCKEFGAVTILTQTDNTA